jgi:lipopolysaccharide transport system ATP-binding protein
MTSEGKYKPGKYKSTAFIPGNLLSEGTLIVGVAICSFEPLIVHFYEKDVIAVQVSDDLDRNGARSIYAGPMLGFLRPKLEWKTMRS